jgi:hypothetical protein
VFAAMFSRTKRVVVAAVKLIVTVLALAGSNTYPVDATMSEKLDPVVLPCTDSVWVRAPNRSAASTPPG